MTGDESPRPGVPPRKTRLPFEERPFGNAMQSGATFLYAVLALGLAALAVYMKLGHNYPLISGYVAAPAIGAVWFGLRLFMMLNSRK